MSSSRTSRRPADRLLTVLEVADRLNVSVAWVRRAIFERRFPVVRLGRLVRVSEVDLEAFVASSRSEPEEVAPLARLRRHV